MTRYVLTPGLDRPDMIHADPIDPERCPVDDEEVLSEDIDESTALGMLQHEVAIACRRCGLKDRSVPGDISELYPLPVLADPDMPEDAEGIG